MLAGGDIEWITQGLKAVEPRVAKFGEINEILAFIPWKLNSKHIEALLKDQNDGGPKWSF